MGKYIALLSVFFLLLQAEEHTISLSKTQKFYTIQLFSVKKESKAEELVRKLPEPFVEDTRIIKLGGYYVGEYGRAATPKSFEKILSMIRKNYFHDAFVKSKPMRKMKESEAVPVEEKRPGDGKVPFSLDRGKKMVLAAEADRAFEEGDIPQAVRIYELLVNGAEPENRRALSNLLYLYGLQGNWVSARELMKKRHGLDALVYAYALGAMHGFRRNEIEHITPFARLDRSGRLMLLLGAFYEREGEMQKAFRWYSAGYAANPGDPYVAYAYARILDMQNRKKEAAKIYARIVQMPFAQKDLQAYALRRLQQIGE
ncbi:tetratricopeptide repeat protein [Hydrogenimonas cancrithermarum]|uniref:SPOR domain-containing protein n=1 Tax=Hydrogenimonas cancrithermarum TaxID=2993563 RepID=A0ABM8FKD5_9BACT|nr:hypothetical protein [Hydrogenimonas cancrithermarum]BDY12771.1 hypothetical protein HCR_10830 [Hydrogenimonas cancrithermarum]